MDLTLRLTNTEQLLLLQKRVLRKIIFYKSQTSAKENKFINLGGCNNFRKRKAISFNKMTFRLVRNNLFYPNSSKFYKELHLESFRYDIVVKANLISAITAAVYSRPGQTRHESLPAPFLIAPNREKTR